MSQQATPVWMDSIEEEGDWVSMTVDEHVVRAQVLMQRLAAGQREQRGLVRTITPIEVEHANMHLQMAALKSRATTGYVLTR